MVSSGVFQSGFRPLFVRRLPQLWRKNRKEREKKEEKGERDREKEEVLRRWAGRCVELVSDLFWGRLWGYLVLKTSKRRGSKQIVLETHAVRKDVQRSGKASTQKRTHCSHCGPERSAAVLKSKHPKSILIVDIRTAAGLSGPQWLQLEYVLGACFSGPLHVFPDLNVYNKSTFWVLAFPDRCRSFRTTMATIRVRFGCLLFRTAAGLSGPHCLKLEYVLGACCSGPLHVFPDRNVYN